MVAADDTLNLDRVLASPDDTLGPQARRRHCTGDVRPEHAAVLVRAERYALSARRLLPDLEPPDPAAAAVDVIARSTFAAARACFRALLGVAHPRWLDRHETRAAAAAAIQALDQSHAAWLVLLEGGLVETNAVTSLLVDLATVRDTLARIVADAAPTLPVDTRADMVEFASTN
jgi:hypothetical protein